jgi:hypothetical protein
MVSLFLSFNLLSKCQFVYVFFVFPSLSAELHAVLSVDAIDMSGKHEVDLDTNIWKVRQFPTSKILFFTS